MSLLYLYRRNTFSALHLQHVICISITGLELARESATVVSLILQIRQNLGRIFGKLAESSRVREQATIYLSRQASRHRREKAHVDSFACSVLIIATFDVRSVKVAPSIDVIIENEYNDVNEDIEDGKKESLRPINL